MTALEKATSLVNKWTSQCLLLSPQDQGIRLIEMIAELIDQAELDAYERGTLDQDEWQDIGWLDEYE